FSCLRRLAHRRRLSGLRRFGGCRRGGCCLCRRDLSLGGGGLCHFRSLGLLDSLRRRGSLGRFLRIHGRGGLPGTLRHDSRALRRIGGLRCPCGGLCGLRRNLGQSGRLDHLRGLRGLRRIGSLGGVLRLRLGLGGTLQLCCRSCLCVLSSLCRLGG